MMPRQDLDGPVTLPGDRLLEHDSALELRTALAEDGAVERCSFQQPRCCCKIRTGFDPKPAVVEYPGVVVTISRFLALSKIFLRHVIESAIAWLELETPR